MIEMNNHLEHAEILTIDDMDLPVYTKKGQLKASYLSSIKKAFDNALDQHPRTLLLRVDLKYPTVHSTGGVSSQQITKFQESFKEILSAYLKRKGNKRQCKPRFIWCKEVVSSEHPHYHVAVLLNGDVFQSIGPYDNITSDYISGMISKAWASATGIKVEQVNSVINFPDNGRYEINRRNDSKIFEEQYKQAFYRVSYFAKEESKQYGSREKNFGSSRK